MIADAILNWLQTGVAARGTRDVEGTFFIASDVGVRRSENQDRVAVLRVGSVTRNREFWCACVCDGMGGMRDGGRAASYALATFFTSLIANRKDTPEARLNVAARDAGATVLKEVPGGGSTMSAMLLEAGRIYTVNVGDSRIYRMSEADGGLPERLTVDDTMEGAYGSEGRGLLQFIGMKSGMVPHVSEVPPGGGEIIITSDGAHLVGDKLLGTLRDHSSNIEVFCSRVLDVANWMGGIDNATIVSSGKIKSASGSTPNAADISVWSLAGRLKIAWTSNSLPSPSPDTSIPQTGQDSPASEIKDVAVTSKADNPPTRKKANKTGSKKSKREQIEIGFSDQREEK